MKIAIPCAEEIVFSHFGHAKQFKIYTVENKEVIFTKTVDCNLSGHNQVVDFLSENEVDTLICGCVGHGARARLKESGISLFPGVKGYCDEAVELFLIGLLDYDLFATCDSCGGHC